MVSHILIFFLNWGVCLFFRSARYLDNKCGTAFHNQEDFKHNHTVLHHYHVGISPNMVRSNPSIAVKVIRGTDTYRQDDITCLSFHTK
jgi:hypothetical protein